MSALLDLEQRDIELRLEEISLKRRQLEIEREQLVNVNQRPAGVGIDQVSSADDVELYLHYSNYAMETHMRIAGVGPDGSIMIYRGENARVVSKKYSMKSLYWIKQMLPVWVNIQRDESHFWRRLAVKYSRRFLCNGESISHTTMEKLCYIVDSGKVDVWFDEYDSLRGWGKQSTLD